MTTNLERAFAAAAKLPDDEQDLLADWILRQLASEERWDRAFADSADALASLADEALAEHRAGRTMPLDPDTITTTTAHWVSGMVRTSIGSGSDRTMNTSR